jgi:hypothetical protein
VREFDGQRFELDYQPGESTTTMFGGNSNWRGAVWFLLNFLLIEALQKHHHFLSAFFSRRERAPAVLRVSTTGQDALRAAPACHCVPLALGDGSYAHSLVLP